MTARRKVNGFTLIEMLLVLVIVSVLVYASIGYVQQRALQMRMDRTSTQMQQILNAGLSYYVMKQTWPGGAAGTAADLSSLQPDYLPAALVNSPFGQPYKIANTGNLFFVYTPVITATAKGGAYSNANVVAGTLPLSYTSTDGSGAPPDAASSCSPTDTTCYIVASVNVPGQNLNNASAVNYAGIYHHGGCIPVPKCPVDPTTFTTMTPQVMVVPVQVSGTSDGGLPATNPKVYPISSFTAYATDPATNPVNCNSGGSPNMSCAAANPTADPSQQYWRACVQVVTEKGLITNASVDWGINQSVMAITRCSVTGEITGGGFNVFSD